MDLASFQLLIRCTVACGYVTVLLLLVIISYLIAETRELWFGEFPVCQSGGFVACRTHFTKFLSSHARQQTKLNGKHLILLAKFNIFHCRNTSSTTVHS